LIFYWGQKQETTHTWFSLFDEQENKTEVVAAAEQLWTGHSTLPPAPKVSDMLVNGKLPGENILLTANSIAEASFGLLSDTVTVKHVEWEIYPEDWHQVGNRNNLIRPLPLRDRITHANGASATFKAPQIEGA